MVPAGGTPRHGNVQDFASFEDRVALYMVRMQEQCERFTELMIRPLEAKVRLLEERQPQVEAKIAEALGGVQGLHTVSESHTRSVEAIEVRCRRWRKLLEDEFTAKQSDMRRELAGEAGRRAGAYVTQDDLLAVVDVLKQELRSVVEEALPRETMVEEASCVAQHQVNGLMAGIDQRVADVEQRLASGEGAPTDSQRDIAEAAEALRGQLALLEQRRENKENGIDTPKQHMLLWQQDLEATVSRSRTEVSDLVARCRGNDAAVEDAKRDVRRLRDEFGNMKSRAFDLEVVTRADAERIADGAFDRWRERLPSVCASPTLPTAQRVVADDGSGQPDATAIVALGVRVDAVEMRQEALRQEVDSCREDCNRFEEGHMASLDYPSGDEPSVRGVSCQRQAMRADIASVWRAVAELSELSGVTLTCGLDDGGANGSLRALGGMDSKLEASGNR